MKARCQIVKSDPHLPLVHIQFFSPHLFSSFISLSIPLENIRYESSDTI